MLKLPITYLIISISILAYIYHNIIDSPNPTYNFRPVIDLVDDYIQNRTFPG